MIEKLTHRWNCLMESLFVTTDTTDQLHRLLESYNEPHRKYHNLQHLNNCLMEFDKVSLLMDDPKIVELALWYHDIYYDPMGNNNEYISMEIATKELDFLVSYQIGKIRSLIMVTKHKINLFVDSDRRFMSDIDLTILGYEPYLFREYCNNIRSEYLDITDQQFITERLLFLLNIINRETIYCTLPFKSMYNEQAVKNIMNEVSRLDNLQYK